MLDTTCNRVRSNPARWTRHLGSSRSWLSTCSRCILNQGLRDLESLEEMDFRRHHRLISGRTMGHHCCPMDTTNIRGRSNLARWSRAPGNSRSWRSRRNTLCTPHHLRRLIRPNWIGRHRRNTTAVPASNFRTTCSPWPGIPARSSPRLGSSPRGPVRRSVRGRWQRCMPERASLAPSAPPPPLPAQ